MRPLSSTRCRSGDRRSAWKKPDAYERHARELALGRKRREFDRLRQQQRWRRRKQSRLGHRHDGADRANIARVLVGVVIGRRLPRRRTGGEGKFRQGRADLRGRRRSVKRRVKVAKRQHKLDHHRQKRDPTQAFDVGANPRHATTHPASKASKGQGPIDVVASFAKFAERCQRASSKCRRNSATLWDFRNARSLAH